MKKAARIALGLTAIAVAGGGGLLWALVPGDVPPAPRVSASAAAISVTRQIESGRLVGIEDGAILSFKGIPYAAPPVGRLRWQPPHPVASWSDVHDAREFGNDCWQNRSTADAARSDRPMSEDCLTINVWAPAKAPPSGAPVMFWIHGGGFVQGSSSQPGLDGSEFAKRGVILVSFNYRLGRFGFFAHPALMEEAQDGATGNWGLMDQAAALRWVHRNIAAFGGNPDQVTLFGQSAGGASVAQMMLTPELRGLFSGAIIQSSGGRNRWVSMVSANSEAPSGLKAGVGFAETQELENPNAAQLRALPASAVLGEISMTKFDNKTFSGPIIDGKLVRSDFVDGFLKGEQAPVPLIVGSTDRELSHLPMLARLGLRMWAKKEIGSSLDQVRNTYSSNDSFDDNIVNDWGFVEPARTMAASHAAQGYPSWLYSFDYVNASKRQELDGAPHASDVTYVFHTLGREGVPPSAEDQLASSQIQSYWLSFARFARPESHGLPLWPLYSANSDRLLRFTMNGPKIDGVTRANELNAIALAMASRRKP